MSAPVLPWAKAPGDNPSAKLGLQRLNLLVIFNGLLRRRLGFSSTPGGSLSRRLRLGAGYLELHPYGPPSTR